MDKLTEVYNDLNKMGVLIFEGSYHLKGECDSVCVSAGKKRGVFFDTDKIKTYAQELEAASHEWAHLNGGYMYTLDAPYYARRKAEVKADRAQICRIIPYIELKEAIESGLHEWWELAEHFNVSEKFIRKAYDYYVGPCGKTFCA